MFNHLKPVEMQISISLKVNLYSLYAIVYILLTQVQCKSNICWYLEVVERWEDWYFPFPALSFNKSNHVMRWKRKQISVFITHQCNQLAAAQFKSCLISPRNTGKPADCGRLGQGLSQGCYYFKGCFKMLMRCAWSLGTWTKNAQGNALPRSARKALREPRGHAHLLSPLNLLLTWSRF